ncbi:MAG: DUF2914 domain-containing protein [Proteobacteria bacterium]|nr:DUF2914 domain-containing protein [Pseudomonadota bacterium]
MDKYTINKRDAEFLKKVDAIRNKNIRVKQKKHLFRLLFCVVIICCLVPVYFVFDSGDGNRGVNKKTAGINMAMPAQSASQKSSAVSLDELSEKNLSQSDPQIGSMTISVLHSNKDGKVEDRYKKNSRKVSPSLPAQPVKKREKNIYVVESAVCKRLKGRNPVGNQDVFYVGQDRCSIVWTEIRSKKLPALLKHVYYLNGEKYCEIPLAIKYPRTRTWSKITLKNEQQVGSWQVDVIEESGRILTHMAFDVKS